MSWPTRVSCLRGNPVPVPRLEGRTSKRRREQRWLEPPFQHPVFGNYTYEAHHLIPGTEKVAPGSTATVMSGHPIEKWIVKGAKVDNDTGYSINNSDNGTWLPSAPAAVKKNRANPTPVRPWASEPKAKKNPAALTVAEKQEIADYAAPEGQFHYGQHKVLAEEGQHYTYPKEVQDRLTELEKRIEGWAKVCLCDPAQSKPPSPPFKPTWQINEKLDLVSIWIEVDITLMPPARGPTLFPRSRWKRLAEPAR